MLTFLTLVALLAALAALGYAWKLQQELAGATRRLDRYNRALFDANDELRSLRGELEQTAAALRVGIMQQSGSLRFAPATTVQEAELIHPQATEVLAGFHVGGCDHCAAAPTDTLAQICTARGLELDTLLANLNLLLAPNAAAAQGGAPVRVKLPNVALEFE